MFRVAGSTQTIRVPTKFQLDGSYRVASVPRTSYVDSFSGGGGGGIL